jgi:hypothetical protein
VKPRVWQQRVIVVHKYWDSKSSKWEGLYTPLPRFVCDGFGVTAIGKTICGAYKNWKSLCTSEKMERDKRCMDFIVGTSEFSFPVSYYKPI